MLLLQRGADFWLDPCSATKRERTDVDRVQDARRETDGVRPAGRPAEMREKTAARRALFALLTDTQRAGWRSFDVTRSRGSLGVSHIPLHTNVFHLRILMRSARLLADMGVRGPVCHTPCMSTSVASALWHCEQGSRWYFLSWRTYDSGVNFCRTLRLIGQILDVSGTPDARFLPYELVAPYASCVCVCVCVCVCTRTRACVWAGQWPECNNLWWKQIKLITGN